MSQRIPYTTSTLLSSTPSMYAGPMYVQYTLYTASARSTEVFFVQKLVTCNCNYLNTPGAEYAGLVARSVTRARCRCGLGFADEALLGQGDIVLLSKFLLQILPIFAASGSAIHPFVFAGCVSANVRNWLAKLVVLDFAAVY